MLEVPRQEDAALWVDAWAEQNVEDDHLGAGSLAVDLSRVNEDIDCIVALRSTHRVSSDSSTAIKDAAAPAPTRSLSDGAVVAFQLFASHAPLGTWAAPPSHAAVVPSIADTSAAAAAVLGASAMPGTAAAIRRMSLQGGSPGTSPTPGAGPSPLPGAGPASPHAGSGPLPRPPMGVAGGARARPPSKLAAMTPAQPPTPQPAPEVLPGAVPTSPTGRSVAGGVLGGGSGRKIVSQRLTPLVGSVPHLPGTSPAGLYQPAGSVQGLPSLPSLGFMPGTAGLLRMESATPEPATPLGLPTELPPLAEHLFGDAAEVTLLHVYYDENADGGLNEEELEALLAHVVALVPPAPGAPHPDPDTPANQWLLRLSRLGVEFVHPASGVTALGLRVLLSKALGPAVPAATAALLPLPPPAPPDGSPPPPRVRLLRTYYHVLDTLGSGKYATVMRAVERTTGREWAVKLLDRGRAGVKGIAAAHREKELLLGMTHPGVVSMADFFESPFRIALVLELVPGGELFDKIVSLKHYSEATAAALVANLFATVAYIHSQGIAHRDIKPENLLLAAASRSDTDESALTGIKLADFGFAARVDPAAPETSLTECCGTPSFIAPEVLEHGYFRRRAAGYGRPADVWSCGVVAYILLCGYPPFHAQTRPKLFQRIVEGRFAFHRDTAWDAVSPLARDFVSKCLHPDPDSRITAAAALTHPWLSSPPAATPLDAARTCLASFSARQKLKGAVFGVEFAARMRYLALCQELKCPPNTQILDKLDDANASIQEIDLSANYVGAKGMRAVVELASAMPRVASLKLSDNQITDDLVSDIATRLTASHAARCPPGTLYPGPIGAVTALDLSHNPITTQGARTLLQLVASVPSVLSIVMLGVPIAPFVAARLDRALATNRALPANQKYLRLRVRPLPPLPRDLAATASAATTMVRAANRLIRAAPHAASAASASAAAAAAPAAGPASPTPEARPPRLPPLSPMPPAGDVPPGRGGGGAAASPPAAAAAAGAARAVP